MCVYGLWCRVRGEVCGVVWCRGLLCVCVGLCGRGVAR